MLGLLRRINRELGTTIVLITHEAEVAARAQRVVRVFDGRIASDEPGGWTP